MTRACMGGWCALRDACANYFSSAMRHRPVERLCAPRATDQFIRIAVLVRMPTRAPAAEKH